MRYLGTTLVVAAIALSACGAEPNAAGTASTVTTTIQENTIETSTPPEQSTSPTTQPVTGSTPVTTVPPSLLVSGEVPPGMEVLVDAAVEDLVQRVSIEPSDVTVVQASEVMWRDSSLGCPLPDFSYLQVLTDGALVVLEADGVTYEYHAGRDNIPFWCENPQPPLAGDS